MRTRLVILFLSFAVPLTAGLRAQKVDADAQQAEDENRPAVLIAESWSRLETSLNGTKNTESRIAAVTALSLLGGDQRAEDMVRTAMHDGDIDLRLAAIVAAGEMSKDKASSGNLPGALREQLNDPDPKVSFTAASTLWKLNDPSGEDILADVAQGERSAEYSALKSGKMNASRTLHSPAALAKIAAQQGIVILVPPVGIGMGAYGYLKGAPAGASPQITAITQLSTGRTQPVKRALIAATHGKDAGARVAAAEALANFNGDDAKDALRALFTDSKEGVRLTASAAYIRVSRGLEMSAPQTSPNAKPGSLR